LSVGDGEVDYGGDAAPGRGARAGVPVVAGDRAAKGQLQVNMDVETAREHVLAGGVQDGRAVGGGPGQAPAKRGDPFAVDGDVRLLLSLGADYRSVGNDGVVSHGIDS